MILALGRVEAPPFEPAEIAKLKHSVIAGLSDHRYCMKSTTQDRIDLPIDYRFLELLLEGSEDPEVGLGQFARGVRVGPGVGITERRAEWFARWTAEVAVAAYVNLNSFEEELGRITYVAGALEYERPFLAPLNRFLTLHRRGTTSKVPSYVSFILRYLSSQLRQQRHYKCGSVLLSSDTAPRVDAQSRTRLFPWFSIELNKEKWPWVYERGDRPALLISTLEALAVLMALKLFYDHSDNKDGDTVLVAPTWTDNRGNGSVLNKLMTTKFSGCALLMELACFMKRKSMKVVVDWTTRLANGIVEDFTPTLEIKVRPDAIRVEVHLESLRMAREAESEFQTLKQQGRLPRRDQQGPLVNGHSCKRSKKDEKGQLHVSVSVFASTFLH